jgi:RNA polymerase sigma-70 factor (ECF subfamily)
MMSSALPKPTTSSRWMRTRFRVFYDRTARPVWAYLSRLTGDPRLADDLLQETYYRFLRARGTPSDEAHRRNYLFRIATNLVHDARRRPRVDAVPMPEHLDHPDPRHADHAGGAAARVDLSRAMARLKPRERALLWLAYAQGSSHKEIAETLGLKTRASNCCCSARGGGSRRWATERGWRDDRSTRATALASRRSSKRWRSAGCLRFANTSTPARAVRKARRLPSACGSTTRPPSAKRMCRRQGSVVAGDHSRAS